MTFLKECAKRIDDGVPSEEVMCDMRLRFTTLRCVNTKVSLVRSLCHPTPAYQDAVDEALKTVTDGGIRQRVQHLATHGGRLHASDHEDVRAIMMSLPPRLSENARALRLSRHESRQCKRTQMVQMINKNKTRAMVDGRTLLAHARSVVERPSECVGGIPELTLALMLVTGRRECELLNGRSELMPHTQYSLTFVGQAKKRDEGIEVEHREERVIPCLAPSDQVRNCLTCLRDRQSHAVLTNVAASLRYQSSLSRHMRCASPWCATNKPVHALRGIYTCMTHALFEWGLHTDAYTAMCILGHTSLTESLVYTTFGIGREFHTEEPHLGEGHLTPPPSLASCDPTLVEELASSSSVAPQLAPHPDAA